MSTNFNKITKSTEIYNANEVNQKIDEKKN